MHSNKNLNIELWEFYWQKQNRLFIHMDIRPQFQDMCYNTSLSNILTHQSYDDLRMLTLQDFRA